MVPAIATKAPEILTGSLGWSVLASAISTVAFFAIGWTLFGIAAFRANVFGRPAAVLLIVGGLATTATFSTMTANRSARSDPRTVGGSTRLCWERGRIATVRLAFEEASAANR